jgi:hypothetical protein
MADEMELETANIEDLLLTAFAKSVQDQAFVGDALGQLEFTPLNGLSEELRWLKQLSPNASLPCGMTAYLLDNVRDKVLLLKKRKSNLMFERDCFAPLYDKITNANKNIILTGNAGIGKSWFQVYLLRRLLKERKNPRFRFVVRQFATDFYLMDLQACKGWKLIGEASVINELLDSLKETLYLYEPGLMGDQPPLLTSAHSLSTLSPLPKRIKEYQKSLPMFLYMPVWELNELAVVAGIEKMEPNDFKDNYYKFGGIIRYTMENPIALRTPSATLEMRCKNVEKGIFRSIATDVVDDPNVVSQRNISGFIVSYVDIRCDGSDAFEDKSLAMTSAYASKKVRENFSLESAQDRLLMLASHLDNKTSDITGIDLESVVVQMLAAGPSTVKWDLCPVGSQAPYTYLPLGHSKRGIDRSSSPFDEAKVNYPTDRIFGLADCFFYVKDVWYAFQTTWRYDHAFKLLTLFEFRQKLGIDVHEKVNLHFVNPTHADSYRKRAKEKYLAKGECADSQIENHRKEVLMTADNVTKMWENTNIFVASPEHNDWATAIANCLEKKVD